MAYFPPKSLNSAMYRPTVTASVWAGKVKPTITTVWWSATVQRQPPAWFYPETQAAPRRSRGRCGFLEGVTGSLKRVSLLLPRVWRMMGCDSAHWVRQKISSSYWGAAAGG